MIDKATIDKILDTVEIVDVISDFVSLKRRGANYIACCPFHNEKTPSFSVSPSKGIFKCFGCGKAGSAVSFVMEHEHLSYTEAIKYLGKKYGIEVNEREESAEDVAQRLKYESLLVVSELAQQYYSETLFNTEIGKAVGLSYFHQARGFSEETIKKFGLGYAPDAKNLPHNFAAKEKIETFSAYAQKKGYKKEFLIGAGLSIERTGGDLVDKFYDRVMFPIHSISGRVIAFGGRTLRTEKEVAKYVNSPETEIYHKSRSLYGIYFAKSAIAKLQKCYLVEGYTDVISLHQAGVENVVASSGTSLTTDQIRLIKRFTNKVTVLYDGDPAGIKASLRGIDMLLEEGMEVKVILFPEGHDPDSYARSHRGDEIVDFFEKAERDFIEFKYELLAKDIAKDPLRRADLIKEIVRTISLIPDQITRSVYIEETARKLDVKQEILVQEVGKTRRAHIESGEYERRRAKEREERKEAMLKSSPSPGGSPYEDVPPPAEEDFYSDNVREEDTYLIATDKRDITAPILETSEREIIYYLVKFGEYKIHFQGGMLYGANTSVMDITVAQYISAELASDDLELINPLYKRLYDLYFQIQSEEAGQEKIQKRFIYHPDTSISKAFLDIVYQEHTINVKEYVKSMIPEETLLNFNVPKSILVYKSKVTEYTCQLIMKQLEKAQKEGNSELQLQFMKQIKILMQVKTQFSKELNRLT